MIDWQKVKYFSPDEFSENPDNFAEPELIYKLAQYREVLNKRVFPSPVKGALARAYGSKGSQHWIGSFANPERKATGVDIFCEGIPYDNYLLLLGLKLFKGVGIYLSTSGPDSLPWTMFHVDIRPTGFKDQPTCWIAKKVQDISMKTPVTRYFYPQKEPKHWRLLTTLIVHKDKKFGSIAPKVLKINPTAGQDPFTITK